MFTKCTDFFSEPGKNINEFGMVYDDEIELTDEQNNAVNSVMDFVKTPNKKRNYIVIGGYAGTGKSSIIPHIRNRIKNEFPNFEVPVVAYTGKACVVLKKKRIPSQTIHHFLYYIHTQKDENGNLFFVFNERHPSDFANVSAVIVDEASMVDSKIFHQLMKINKPIIFIGDHFQLPPVGDNFNIMSNPDVELKTVLRQKESAIIDIATMCRCGEKIPFGKIGNCFHLYYDKMNQNHLPLYNQIITWTNRRRKYINDIVRRSKGYLDPIPRLGEKLIVKKTSYRTNVFNGQMVIAQNDGKINKYRKWGELYDIEFMDEFAHNDILALAEMKSVPKALISLGWTSNQIDEYTKKGFDINDKKNYRHITHMDYGYAITCHNSQGSSWEDVCLIDEYGHDKFDEYPRWLYTGVTRAEKRIVIYSEV